MYGSQIFSTINDRIFNKILIDAPCSGEGMFRKGNNEIKNWQEKGSEPYAKLQREIVDDAIKLLAPGGIFALFYLHIFTRRK